VGVLSFVTVSGIPAMIVYSIWIRRGAARADKAHLDAWQQRQQNKRDMRSAVEGGVNDALRGRWP
jgi:hypothetical protein